MSLSDKVREARAAQSGAIEGTIAPQSDQRAAAEVSGYRVLSEMLRTREGLYGRALPEHGPTATQLITDALTALSVVPKLDECAPSTFLGGLMTIAQLGLRLGGALGQAYLLPFWNKENKRREATFVLGYKGLVTLAHRSGYVRGITARTVFERDTFELDWREDRDELHHRPYLLGPDPGQPRMYYARVLLADGGYQLGRPVHRESMRAHRARYVMVKSGPWFDDRGVAGDGFEAMSHKTVLKTLGRTLPLSPDARYAIAADGGVRSDESPDAPPDQVTEHTGEAEVEPGQAQGTPEAAYDPEWPEGAVPVRPAGGA
jgi:recombination protein RecT